MFDDRPENVRAREALERLEVGNKRFVSDNPIRPNINAARRRELVAGQHPFATIISCADSRVPAEFVFDQGLGDLFVVRGAGNISDDAVLGSVEYASLHLGVNLIVVMGHRTCGAVSAAVDNVDVDGPATDSHIDALIGAIRPAVRAARNQGNDDLLDRSIRENATIVAEQIRSSEPIIAGLERQGVEVHSAYYDLKTGKVDWLS
jgi:carbonic anhydrase